MPEESPAGEIDLSNIDNLLSDLEKDLPNIEKELQKTSPAPAGSAPAEGNSPEPEAAIEVESPAGAPAVPEKMKSEPVEVEIESAHEMMGSPVRPSEKDEHPDDLEDMFTDEEEPEWSSGDTINGVEEESAPVEAAPPPVAAAAAPAPKQEPVPIPIVEPAPSFEDALEMEPIASAAKDSEIAFEDALELEEEKPAPLPPPMPPPPAAAPAAPVRVAAPAPVKATAEEFRKALLDKKFDVAAQIGRSLKSPDSTPSFRINLAGALYYAGQNGEAEQELTDLLKQSPYNIPARRNLERVRAGKS